MKIFYLVIRYTDAMKTKKIVTVFAIFGFLTTARAQLGVIGGDMSYTNLGSNQYGFTVSMYSHVPLTYVLVGFDGGASDTLPLSQTLIQPGVYFGSASFSHIYPGPGIFNITVESINWTGFNAIWNMPGSDTIPFIMQSSLVISPLFTPNESVSFTTSQTVHTYAGGFYYHDPLSVNPDGDSVAYTLALIPGTINGVNYMFPSQMGGSEAIDTSGVLQTMVPQNGYFAFNITATDWRETTPGQFYVVGSTQRLMLLLADITVVPEMLTDNITLYPNPATDYIQFPENESYDVLVFDMQGKQVLQQQAVKGKLHVTALAAGTYNLYVVNNKNGNGSAVKFTKQ